MGYVVVPHRCHMQNPGEYSRRIRGLENLQNTLAVPLKRSSAASLQVTVTLRGLLQ